MRVLPSLRIVALSATLACLAQAGQAASLFEAYRMARENDRQWRFAQARHLESREFVPQARSQLLPVVGVNASELSQTQQLTTAGVSRPEQQYPTSTRALTLRQPLLIARQLDGLRLAQARELQGDMNLLEEEQQLALRLADAYFNHLLSLDRKTALDAQKTFVMARLEAVTAALRSGQGTRTDVDEAAAELDRLRAQEIQLEQAARLTRRQLEIITGRPLEQVRPLGGAQFNADAFPLGPLDEVLAAALASNKALLAAGQEVEITRAALRQSSKGHLPTLDLVAQVNQGTGENQFFATTTNRSRSIGVQFALPLYSGGLTQSQVRQASAKLVQAEEQFESIANTLRVQVQTEHDGVRRGAALLVALQTAAKSAEQALLSSQKGQQAGVRTTLDVLRADSQRSQVRLELAQARYDLLRAWLKLRSLEGKLGEQALQQVSALMD